MDEEFQCSNGDTNSSERTQIVERVLLIDDTRKDPPDSSLNSNSCRTNSREEAGVRWLHHRHPRPLRQSIRKKSPQKLSGVSLLERTMTITSNTHKRTDLWATVLTALRGVPQPTLIQHPSQHHLRSTKSDPSSPFRACAATNLYCKSSPLLSSQKMSSKVF